MYLILREVVGRFYETLFNDAVFVVWGVSFPLGLLKLSEFLRVYFGCSVGVYVAGEMVFIWTWSWIWHFFC